MPDYKEMYFKMVKATEDAMRILIKAQQDCEEMYVSSKEPEIYVFPEVIRYGGKTKEADAKDAEK